MTKDHARKILYTCGIDDASRDFDQLSSSTVTELLDWADVCKYRKPKNANGSRARYFHDFLQRRARSAKP